MAYETDYARSGYDRTITAMFERREDAQSAIENLVAAGIPRDRISMVAGSSDYSAARAQTEEEGGFWESLANFFFPDEDRYTYAEGLRRGGHMVTVRTDTAHYDTALDILDDEGAIDLEEREQAWRAEGWRGFGGRTDTDATGFWRTASNPDASTARVPVSPPKRDMPSASQPMQGAGAGSGQYMQEMYRNEDYSREGTIPVVEENLRIGKRDVSHGRVRVRSYIVEEPVSEDVNLHSERVDVERRPVDRPATAEDDLFRDRTIEAEEYSEEPVVSKDARVTEEVGLRKEREDHTETVSDTVRHTEVEIDDERDDGDLSRRDYNGRA
jgi:uncharacterized protein (TIGR02271 family)